MAHLHFSFSKLPAELQCYYIGMWLDTYPWNRIQNLEINPHICNQLIFNKHTKKINWGKNGLSINDAEKLGIYMQKEEAGPDFTLCVRN